MKIKLVSFILALATLTTLTACENDKAKNNDDDDDPSSIIEASDNSSDDKNDVSDESSENLPEDDGIFYTGTWRIVPGSYGPFDYLAIDEYGNITEFKEMHDGSITKSVGYSFDIDESEITEGETISFNLNHKNGVSKGTISFIPVGDTYGINMQGIYFYNQDEFNLNDYDVIELTDDNASKYIEEVREFLIETDSNGEIRICSRTELKFKEGLGAPSFIWGDLKCKSISRPAFYDSNTNEIKFGEIPQNANIREIVDNVNFCGIGSYEQFPASQLYPQFTDNGDGTYNFESVRTYEIIGAEDVKGQVYAPKDWNK